MWTEESNRNSGEIHFIEGCNEKVESTRQFEEGKSYKELLTTYTGLTTAAAAAKSLQSCPTLCDPIDSSPPGYPVPGILQARTLECVAISFSKA